jgi:hypothetical protein
MEKIMVKEFLEELSNKHNCPVYQIVIGIIGSSIHVWRYQNDKWKQLEVINLYK